MDGMNGKHRTGGNVMHRSGIILLAVAGIILLTATTAQARAPQRFPQLDPPPPAEQSALKQTAVYDLEIVSFTGPATAAQGEDVRSALYVEVVNNGPDDLMDAFEIALYLSADGTLDMEPGSWFSRVTYPGGVGLAAGASIVIEYPDCGQATIPLDADPGAQTLVAWYQKNAERDGIQATPSFIVNGEKVDNQSYADFKKLIEAELGS